MAEILLTGVFRSGTTLLAKLLTFHPRILLATDAYLFYFRQVRNYWYRQKAEGPWDPDEPMADNFLHPNHEAARAIWQGDLSSAISPEMLAEMPARIDYTTIDLHPGLVPKIPSVTGRTFAEYYRNLLVLLHEVYGATVRDPQYVGIKMPWLDEFIPALTRSFPAHKAIVIVRDIRAVVASQNSKGVTRPLLFYARAWRKSVACAHYFAQHDEFKDRVHVLRYEDLVRAPEESLRGICRFLDVEYEPSMLDVGGNVDETGARWAANTSYETARPGIYPTSIDRWRRSLSEYEARYLEWLCGPEMRLMNYAPIHAPLAMSEILRTSPEPPYETLVDWLQGTAAAAHVKNRSCYLTEVAKEALRLQLLTEEAAKADEDTIARMFHFPEVYDTLRRAEVCFAGEGL